MVIQKCCRCSKPFSYKEVVRFCLRGKILECSYCKTRHKEAGWFEIIFYVASFFALFLLGLINDAFIFNILLWMCCWTLTYPFLAKFEIDKK